MGQVYYWPGHSAGPGTNDTGDQAASRSPVEPPLRGASAPNGAGDPVAAARHPAGCEGRGTGRPGSAQAQLDRTGRPTLCLPWLQLGLAVWRWWRRVRAQRRRRSMRQRLARALKPVGLGSEALEWLPQLAQVVGVLVDDGLVLDAPRRRLERIWTPGTGEAAVRLRAAVRQLLRVSVQSLPIGPENRLDERSLAEPGQPAETRGDEWPASASRPGRWARLGVWIAPQLERVYFTHHLWTPARGSGRVFALSILRGTLRGVALSSSWSWDEQGRLLELTPDRFAPWQQAWEQMVAGGSLPLAVAVKPWRQRPARWAEVREAAGAVLLGLAELGNPLQPRLSAGLEALRHLGVRVIWQSQLEPAVARALAVSQPGLESAEAEEALPAPLAGPTPAERPVWLRLQWLPDGTLLLRWWREGDLRPAHTPVAWRLSGHTHPLEALGKLCRLGQAFR